MFFRFLVWKIGWIIKRRIIGEVNVLVLKRVVMNILSLRFMCDI